MSFWRLPELHSNSSSSMASIPPLLLSASFLRSPSRFVLAGSPNIPRLQTLGKIFPDPASIPVLVPVILKSTIDEEQIETIYLRPHTDVIYLPLLATLDIEHFVSCQENQALKQIALLVADIETVSYPPRSPAGKIVFGLPQLNVVYAVEGGHVGDELSKVPLREKYPDDEWEMLEVPEVQEGPPPGDAMDMFGGYHYPNNPWVKQRKAQTRRYWEEQMEKTTVVTKPKLECKYLKRRIPQML